MVMFAKRFNTDKILTKKEFACSDNLTVKNVLEIRILMLFLCGKLVFD